MGFSCAFIFTLLRNSKSFDFGIFIVAAAIYTLAFIALLPLWPQIRFKSAVRSLTINAQGLTTSIGKIFREYLKANPKDKAAKGLLADIASGNLHIHIHDGPPPQQ